MRRVWITLVSAGLLALGISGCGLQLKPLKSMVSDAAVTAAAPGSEKVVYRFFDEDFISGGYPYWYPDNSNVFIPEESGKNGEVSIQFDLEANDYSGGSVCLWNLLYDATPYYRSGAMQFWIKGKNGGEIAWAALVDEENTDGKKTVVRLPIQNYGGIKKEWTQITIPLADFGKRGVFWDAKKRVEVPNPFSWDMVSEFRLEIKKADNPEFTAWVDDIFICKDMFAPREDVDEEYWDEREEKIVPPPVADRPQVVEKRVLFGDDVPGGGFVYVYGGKTAYKVHPSTPAGDKGILTCYLDNDDYSGITVAMGAGKSFDLTADKKAKAAGIAFWAKGAPNVNSVYLGILDDESDGMKVQTKLAIADFGKIDTTWKYFMIPIRRFQDVGKYWDETKKAEVVGDVRWDQINEIRFSTNKAENRLEPGEPVVFYVDQIAVIEEIPGYVDPEEYWANFKSDKPDVMLLDFENLTDLSTWEASKGPKSEISYELVPSEANKGGKQAIEVTFKLNDWCDAVYHFKRNNEPAEKRDWSKHWGIKFEMYTDKAYQGINVQVNDAGGEVFIASAGCPKGWHEVLVPFKAFYKFPYWQPPDAEQNGKFDMEAVQTIDFKPSGEGTSGMYKIDNVRLTNEREVFKPKAPEKIDVAVTGSFSEVITEKINDGLFGINIALWDGDMLKPQTAEYVKAINHSVLRYPGGLRADDDHWKEVLDKKDWMVDTDEMLEFCDQTGTTPMITVNFGKGTPEEAAAWVKHVNVDLKKNVKYWEIGNELYGNWHPDFTTGDDYGKRAAQFIKAMKAVDPSIIVTVVWVLDGDWNRDVFKHTKDLADGVNVHHYPQHAGEENDAALLSAAMSLNDILPGVRKQLEEFGTPGKKYEVWLTEWNSVDFKPGPQTLSIVNALFVADYLGTLTRHNIEQASYWDVHNDITEQGGDYGYLSRTGAPDGDNVPRSSYWAFKIASESLRGKLTASKSSNENVATYLTENGGAKTLLIINKQPETKAVVTLKVPGFSGNGTLKQLRPDNASKGYSSENVQVKNGMKITLPAYSITSITVK
ncbi:MAG: hypothetical protein JW863_03595 [Chitinispirillaceae bacterium]|nr:hypothetical protein [Chitinispirillaceae bacterium]